MVRYERSGIADEYVCRNALVGASAGSTEPVHLNVVFLKRWMNSTTSYAGSQGRFLSMSTTEIEESPTNTWIGRYWPWLWTRIPSTVSSASFSIFLTIATA